MFDKPALFGYVSPQVSTFLIIPACLTRRSRHERPSRRFCRPRPVPRGTRSPLDAVHGEPQFKAQAAHPFARQGRALLDGRRPPDPRRRRRPVVRERRPWPQGNQPGRGALAGADGLRAALPDGPPAGLRPGQQGEEDRARRPGPCVLRELRLRGGGHGAEDRPAVPAPEGRSHPHAPDRPRARLPRREPRRHHAGRHGRQPQGLGPGDDPGRRSPAPHAQPGEERLLEGPARARRGTGQRARAAGGAARCLEHRRGHRRAHRRLHRRAGAAEGLPAEAARAVHQARHPADIRRGHHRLRPHRLGLRRAGIRRDAGHHHLRQGPDQRLGAHGRRAS